MGTSPLRVRQVQGESPFSVAFDVCETSQVLHQGHKLVKQKRRVHGAGAGFGVELHGEGPVVGVVDALAGLVVGVYETHPARGQAVRHHGIAVILAGDVGMAGDEVAAGLVGPAMAVLELFGLSPNGQRQ